MDGPVFKKFRIRDNLVQDVQDICSFMKDGQNLDSIQDFSVPEFVTHLTKKKIEELDFCLWSSNFAFCRAFTAPFDEIDAKKKWEMKIDFPTNGAQKLKPIEIELLSPTRRLTQPEVTSPNRIHLEPIDGQYKKHNLLHKLLPVAPMGMTGGAGLFKGQRMSAAVDATTAVDTDNASVFQS